MEVIQSIRAHFPEYFAVLRENDGAAFTHIAALRVPEDDTLHYLMKMELWAAALEAHADAAYHALALHSDEDVLNDALQLAVEAHDAHAVICILARLQSTQPQLGRIQCSVMGCANCKSVRVMALRSLLLSPDWTLCRQKMTEARQRNLWTLWLPLLATNPATAETFAEIRQRSQKNWTSFAAAVVAVIVWRRWVLRQMEPGSRFVRAVGRRFAALQLRGPRARVVEWGGEIDVLRTRTPPHLRSMILDDEE